MKFSSSILAMLSGVLLQATLSPGATNVTEDAKHQRAFDEAVDKGLSFLARSQGKDGSIGGPETPALTSLAVMAFLARGYTPGLPPYGETINRGVDFILSVRSPDGHLMGRRGEMYSHNISCLMLSEVSGMLDPERQARVDVVLPRAIQVTLAAQNVKKEDAFAGGWQYQPNTTKSDISHSGWALAALRSARNNGAPVPKEAVDKAVKFILRCRTTNGGFAYQPGGGANLARTGIGLLCMELAGRHRDEATLKAGELIRKSFSAGALSQEVERYYALYYMANGMFQLGGQDWETFCPVLYNTILGMQSADGSWPGGGHAPNTQYSTSMAILALSVSYRQLPIYQR